MLESALVYGLLTIVMVLCGAFASRRQLAFEKQYGKYSSHTLSFAYLEIWLPIVLFTIIFGCRFDVGIDQMTYLEWYKTEVPARKELLWKWVTEGMSACGIHYAIYFSLWAFLQIFLIYYTLRNYMFLFPYIAFYLIVGNFFLPMMNTIRFSLVACIFFYATKFIQSKQFWKYFLCIFISIFIHKTAIALLLIYPLLTYKEKWFNKKIQWILLAFGIFLMLSKEFTFGLIFDVFSFVIDKFHYQEGYSYSMNIGTKIFDQSSRFGRNTGIGSYVILFVGCTIMLFHSKMEKKYNSSFFDIAYTMWFISFIGGLAVGSSFVLNRPLLYLSNFKMVIMSFFTHYCLSSKKIGDKLLGILFIIIHIALFINIISMGDVNKSAFKFFWQF